MYNIYPMLSTQEFERTAEASGVATFTFREVAVETTRTIREVFARFNPRQEALLIQSDQDKVDTVVVRGIKVTESGWPDASFYARRTNRATGETNEFGLSGIGRRNFRMAQANDVPERVLKEIQLDLYDGLIFPYTLPEGFWKKQQSPDDLAEVPVVMFPTPQRRSLIPALS